MAIVYSKLQLIQRIKQHIANGFPSYSFSATNNEVLLYIDTAIAFTIVGQCYAGAKLSGSLEMPEGWLITYQLEPLVQDRVSKFWYSSLPQPPLSLPLGYSITDVRFGDLVLGKSKTVMPIKTKRVAYRENMPIPFGVRYWIEGSKIWLAASNGQSLLNQNVYVQMPATRTTDINAPMNMPDDAIELIFKNVTDKLIQRMQIPKDIIQDNLPAGNKSS